MSTDNNNRPGDGTCGIGNGHPESYQQSDLKLSKKREMKKRTSPQAPYRVKAKGKEISRSASSTVYRAYVPARIRVRANLKCLVAAAVEKALIAFGGSRGAAPSDEALWAAIAWRVGAQRFYDTVIEKIHENKADGLPRNLRASFQNLLNKRFPKGGAK